MFGRSKYIDIRSSIQYTVNETNTVNISINGFVWIDIDRIERVVCGRQVYYIHYTRDMETRHLPCNFVYLSQLKAFLCPAV